MKTIVLGRNNCTVFHHQEAARAQYRLDRPEVKVWLNSEPNVSQILDLNCRGHARHLPKGIWERIIAHTDALFAQTRETPQGTYQLGEVTLEYRKSRRYFDCSSCRDLQLTPECKTPYYHCLYCGLYTPLHLCPNIRQHLSSTEGPTRIRETLQQILTHKSIFGTFYTGLDVLPPPRPNPNLPMGHLRPTCDIPLRWIYQYVPEIHDVILQCHLSRERLAYTHGRRIGGIVSQPTPHVLGILVHSPSINRSIKLTAYRNCYGFDLPIPQYPSRLRSNQVNERVTLFR